MEASELEKSEEQRKAEEDARTKWYKVVPLWVKLAILALFALLLNAYMTQGGSPKKYLVYFAALGFALWLWSMERKKEKKRLTVKEMMDAVERELKTLQRDGRLGENPKWWVGPVSGYKAVDSNFVYGIIRVVVLDDWLRTDYQALVDAYDAKYVNLQQTVGLIHGDEGVPVRTPVPQVLKWLKRHELESVFLRGKRFE